MLSQLLIVLVSIYNRQNTTQKKDQVFITFLCTNFLIDLDFGLRSYFLNQYQRNKYYTMKIFKIFCK